jgi:hypothetical protein
MIAWSIVTGPDSTKGVYFSLGQGAVQSIPIQEIVPAIVQVYPNPFSCSVTFKAGSELQNGMLLLHSLLGAEVKRIGKIHGKEIVLETGSLASGVYFYELYDDRTLIGRGKLIAE